MESKFSNELTVLAARLMLCESKKEILNISNEFGKLIERVIEQEEKAYTPCAPSTKSVTATIKFTKQEVAPMAETLKRDFIANGLCARIIKRESGSKFRKTYVYEIRYRRNGYCICISSKDLAEAKRRFIEATKPENIDRYITDGQLRRSGKDLFREIAAEWLLFKKGKICEQTHGNYESYYRRYILPVLGEKLIKEIRTIDIDRILQGKTPRLYEELRGICNSIFKYAIASGVLTYNPVMLIPFRKAERKTERRTLTKEETERLIVRLQLPKFQSYKRVFLVMFYFGLRPCELNGARFEGDFLISRNAKRKGGKIEYKKIPIPKQLHAHIEPEGEIKQPHNTEVLNRIFKRIMQDENVTQYYLRHTFASVCQQYVRPDIVDIWMGDSSERLVGRVYTHFSDDFMIEQMEKVVFDV